MSSNSRQSISDVEYVLGDTIARIADMDERMRNIEAHVQTIPEIKVIIGNVSASVAQMAAAAQSMAETFCKAEERAAVQDSRFDALTKLALGTGQMPIESHQKALESALINQRWNMFGALLPLGLISICVIISILYITKTDIKASLKEIVVNQSKTQEAILDAKKELQGDASRDKAERKHDDDTRK